VVDLDSLKFSHVEIISSIKEAFPRTPIVVVFGYETRRLDIEIAKIGVLYRLFKPVNPVEIHQIIKVADNRRKRDRSYQRD